jgi:hypothetical protein
MKLGTRASGATLSKTFSKLSFAKESSMPFRPQLLNVRLSRGTVGALPEDHNWSSVKLNEAWRYAQAIGSGAVLVIDDGVVVGQWGAVDRKWHVLRFEGVF